jgi:hypothetical protein
MHLLKRALYLALVAPTACTCLHLTRGPEGWAVQQKSFTIEPIKDGRIMPDGWLLQNYDKVAKGQYTQRQEAEVDLTFGRSSDDGFVSIDEMNVESQKTLRTLADRIKSDLRTRQLEVSIGRYRALVEVDEPVTELASGTIAGDGIEGYELVLAQRHRGETDAYRHVYFALIRSHARPGLLTTVCYVNTPAAFRDGVADARGLARRVKIGGAALGADLPILDADPSKAPPGAPVRL